MESRRVNSVSKKPVGKKDFEEYILKRFISNDSLKIPIVSVKTSETPDFIVKSIGKDISIELTRFIDSKLKKVEAFEDKIIEEAEQLFLECYNIGLRVYVTFLKTPLKCSLTEAHKLSEEIFAIVEKQYLANKEFEFSVSSRNSRRPFNKFIDTIHIDNHFNFSNWQTMNAYKIDRVDFIDVKSIIQSKEMNIPKYNKIFNENWLVIISNLGTKSSAHDFAFLNYEAFHTGFERVFIYKYIEDKIIEIDSQNGVKSPFVFTI